VAAFGAEGTEVIRKTNDYLNRIATTDPQRALLLAGFINEDPLGWAEYIAYYEHDTYIESASANGLAYLIIDYYLNDKSEIDIVFSGKTMSSNKDMLFGANNASGNCESYSTSGNRWMIRQGGKTLEWNVAAYANNKPLRMTQRGADVTLKDAETGEELELVTNTGTRASIAATTKLYLFTIARSASTLWNDGLRIQSLSIAEDGTQVVNLLPVTRKADGEIGMFDIKNRTFYANAGTGKFIAG
jgi:hypothetical protein